MQITCIKKTKRGMNAIYIDGEYKASIDSETLVKSRWKVGTSLDYDDFSQVITMSEDYRAKEKAMRLISFRSHSKKELKDKIKRSINEESAEKAVNKLESLGLVNDESFCLMYAKEMFFRKKFAVSRVKYELAQKGISRELADKIIEEINPDAREQLSELLQGKYRGKFNDEKNRRRTIASLQRLGYKWEYIKNVMYQECDSMVEDDF